MRLFLAALAALTLSFPLSAERVEVGMYQTPPLLFRDSTGTPSGLYPDLLREIAAREDWQVEWVDASWPELRSMLGRGELDLLPAIAYTEERDSLYDFNGETVLSNWAVVFGRPGTSIESIIDLDGKAMAVLESDVYYTRFRDLAESFDIECDYVESPTYDSVMLALDRGRAEAALVPRLYAAREEDRFDVSRTPILCCPIELLFAVPPGENAHLIAALDRHLRAFREDPGSVYHESLNRWLGSTPESSPGVWLWWLLGGLATAAAVFLVLVLVTRRKVRAATAELRESNAQMQAILDGSPDVITLLGPDYTVRWANRAAQSMTDSIGRKCHRAFANLSSPCPGCPVRPAMESGEIDHRVMRREGIVSTRGETFWDDTAVPMTDEKGDIEGVVVISRDITEQVEAQRRIRQSEEKYRTVVEGSRDGIIIHRNGRIVFANRACFESLGYHSGEVLDHSIMDFIVPGQHQPVSERMEGRARGEDVPSTFETTLRKGDGGLLPVEVNASIIEYDGEPAFIVFLRDITERRELERQLRQAQKMEAVGQLAGGVAHDFNNLLQVITGYTGVAMETLPEDAEACDKLKEVASAGEKAARLVRQLLAFSRKRSISLEPLSVGDTIGSHLEMLERIIGEDIELKFSCQENLPAIRGDRGMLEQVLANLFLNARDAMPEGGRIRISARTENLDAESCSGYPWAQPGEYVAIYVEDTGTGMPPGTLERIFEPFFTTKDQGGGSGLGLSTVYGIVKQHGGMISATSVEGDGTIFRILFPAVDDRPSRSQRKDVSPPAGGGETILLAEDNREVRNLLEEILDQAGYRVVSCDNGREAAHIYQTADDRPALVILDIIMPGMGGLEAARRILETDPDARILLCSGYSDRAEEISLDGSYFFIRKPFTRNEILTAVRRLLD
ncbi:MAG: PAS domain S-box protein [Candidatus Fermentibacteraceae bacterium]